MCRPQKLVIVSKYYDVCYFTSKMVLDSVLMLLPGKYIESGISLWCLLIMPKYWGHSPEKKVKTSTIDVFVINKLSIGQI